MILWFFFTEPIGATSGKCSHGGKDDSSRTSIARCGINKESVEEEYSPHNHLHKDAFRAAVKATKNFLIANGGSFKNGHNISVSIFLYLREGSNTTLLPETPRAGSGVKRIGLQQRLLVVKGDQIVLRYLGGG